MLTNVAKDVNTKRIAAAALAVALAKLAVHLYAGRYYGYFIDELYYLACSHHLGWGYVDQPPLIALVAWFEIHVFGTSLSAIRLLPAIAGACEVALTAAIAREFGGGQFAQFLAALGVLAAPGILSIDNFLSMNAFEPLFWMGCAWVVIRIVKSGDRRLWIWFGMIAGVGLENKYSMLIFGAGLAAGLLLTRERRQFASGWIWAGAAIAFLIFLPNLIWNIHQHFPFLELQANIKRSGRDVALGPVAFFAQEALAMQPVSLPVWAAGLWFFFVSKRGQAFRCLGCAWVFTAVAIVIQSPRIYYLFPAAPLMFAAGAVVWEDWLQGRVRWLRIAYPALIAVTGAILAPLAIPVLPPETYIHYTQAMHLAPPAIENHELGPLPQIYADQFGWDEMAATVAKAYNALPPDVRARTGIFGQIYGQAGAIDFFGPKYGLPHAISGHQSYWLWGYDGYDFNSMIVLDDNRKRLEELFTSVTKVGHVEHPYSMPYEHFDIFYCTGLKGTVQELWPKIKRWG